MDMGRRKLAHGIRLVRICRLANIKLLELGRCLIGKRASLVLGEFHFLTLLIKLTVNRILVVANLDKTFAQLPTKRLQRSVVRTLLSLLPLARRIQTRVPPDCTSSRRPRNVDVRK